MGYIKREPRFGAAIGRVIGHRYDGGGKISQQKTEARGVTEFNTGGSHEENKYGGIPQGVAPDGAPNLVEEGEVKLKDIIGVDNQYILSNRIMLDAEHAEEYGIPQSVVGLTYAAAFKKLYSPLKERSGNIEVKNEIAHLANAFMEAQDSVKAEQEARQMGDMMQAMPPEALAQMAQAAQGQQTQQPMPPQGAPPEAMGQGMPQPGMGQMPQQPGMEGQGMPPEMMQGGAPQGMPQGMPPEAMQGGVDPSMMQQAGGMPMMARGGRMRTFAKGGKITTNKDNMFQGIFEHRFAEGGSIKNDKSPDKAKEKRVHPSEESKRKWLGKPENRKKVRGFAKNTYEGKYGNGEERKKKLGWADNAIQSIVNEAVEDRDLGFTPQETSDYIFSRDMPISLEYKHKFRNYRHDKNSDEVEKEDNGITDVDEPSEIDEAENRAKGGNLGRKEQAAIDIADAESERQLRSSAKPRVKPSTDIFQGIPSGDDSEQPQQGGGLNLDSMSNEDLSSLVEQLTALLRSRQQGGRPGDTDEMDEILAKTEGRGGY